MPFTFAHPSIVLPLSYLGKKWVSVTGLVIGSIVPDFEYFIRMGVKSKYSHTIPGLFWFDLPLGILLSFMFHCLVKRSLFNNLPAALGQKLTTFTEYNWIEHFKMHWVVVVISILIGACSHLLWDGFTHYNGYFVRIIPILRSVIGLKQYPVYKILQHLSSLLGSSAIIFVFINMPKYPNTVVKADKYYWMIVATIMVTIVTARLLSGLNYKPYGDLIVTTISSFLVAIIISPILLFKMRGNATYP
jgi:hypothetical protein